VGQGRGEEVNEISERHKKKNTGSSTLMIKEREQRNEGKGSLTSSIVETVSGRDAVSPGLYPLEHYLAKKCRRKNASEGP